MNLLQFNNQINLSKKQNKNLVVLHLTHFKIFMNRNFQKLRKKLFSVKRLKMPIRRYQKTSIQF
jgi:hypothetical protein